MLFAAVPLALAGMAAASPLARRACPPTSQARGFTLVANVSDPTTTVFNSSVNGWFLSGVHSGGGISTAILNPDGGAVFFVNGTSRDVAAAATSIALPPVPVTGSDPSPMGLQFDPAWFQNQGDNYTAFVGLNYGLGTPGAGVNIPNRDPIPSAFAPYAGSFIVCNETRPVYPNPQYPVRYAQAHIVDSEGHERTDIPDGCVAITLLAQCADLPALEGVDQLNITVEAVNCYEKVADIDWSKY